MASSADIRKIAFVADYMPRKCGIATFTFDLRNAVASQYQDIDCIVVPVDDIDGGYDYPNEVRFEIQEQELASYRRAADYLNFANVDVVCLQHEFGIYGGPEGGHVLALMRDLRVPVVSTLHTVLQSPNEDQLRVMQKLCELSSRVVVMSERSRKFLIETYRVAEEKTKALTQLKPKVNKLQADEQKLRDAMSAMKRAQQEAEQFIAATIDRLYWANALTALRNALIAVEAKKEKEFNAKTGVWIEKMAPQAPPGFLAPSMEGPGAYRFAPEAATPSPVSPPASLEVNEILKELFLKKYKRKNKLIMMVLNPFTQLVINNLLF